MWPYFFRLLFLKGPLLFTGPQIQKVGSTSRRDPASRRVLDFARYFVANSSTDCLLGSLQRLWAILLNTYNCLGRGC